MRHGRHSEAQLEVARLIERYKAASTVEELQEIAQDAADTRVAYGEWRVRSLFSETDLLKICVERVQELLKDMLSSLVCEHICFAINNLKEDEDAIRVACRPACTEVFVPKQRWPGRVQRPVSAAVPGWPA